MQARVRKDVHRALDLRSLLEMKSHFLFGPRQSGKTHLIRSSLPDVNFYDLLQPTTFLQLSQNPGAIARELRPNDRFVVIDEIQRLPDLLNTVHGLIESRKIHFLLTGSSARKLRRGNVNLLGGRAWTRNLHPFCYRELGPHYDLDSIMECGLIPGICFSPHAQSELKAYAGTYLQQEVVGEAVVREVEGFSRFLRYAALSNATVVNFTNLANDAQVPRTTVYEYYEILKDTLIAHELPAWRGSAVRKPIVSSKYYFFDVGVLGALQGRSFAAGTSEYGTAFETLLMHELVCYRDYLQDDPLSFWRSTSGFEVDFLIGDHTAIEVKAKKHVAPRELKSLRALAEEKRFKRLLCVSLDDRPWRDDGIEVLPFTHFLQALWAGEYR